MCIILISRNRYTHEGRLTVSNEKTVLIHTHDSSVKKRARRKKIGANKAVSLKTKYFSSESFRTLALPLE
jgi:hypothetical protein